MPGVRVLADVDADVAAAVSAEDEDVAEPGANLTEAEV
jgi:hypothetical protein